MKAPSDPKGYTDPGAPTNTHSDKKKKLGQADLLESEGMDNSENTQATGHSVGGFLKRNNYGDRC